MEEYVKVNLERFKKSELTNHSKTFYYKTDDKRSALVFNIDNNNNIYRWAMTESPPPPKEQFTERHKELVENICKRDNVIVILTPRIDLSLDDLHTKTLFVSDMRINGRELNEIFKNDKVYFVYMVIINKEPSFETIRFVERPYKELPNHILRNIRVIQRKKKINNIFLS